MNMLRIFSVALLFIIVIIPNNGYRIARDNQEERELFDTYQAILNEGYPAENHHVTTNDGYILQVTRIPYGKNQNRDNSSRPVVFMMHGLLGAANTFILLGSEYSMGYQLADAGFDIWMGNARGNYYSRFHVTLDPDHPEEKFEFFDFTFEEIGMYDLATMIDYILEKTGQEKLHYIGHSQGGTAFLVLNTMRPEYNEKIRSAHLLAGVGYQEYFPNAQLAFVARLVDSIYDAALAEGLVEYFPLNLTLEERANRNSDYCFGDIRYKAMCNLVGSRELVRADEEENSAGLAGASLKQIAHFGQNVRDKLFRRWHYGDSQNIEEYGTSEPPLYDLSLITTYVTMHYSLSDILLDERDVLAMAADMPNTKVHKVARESFLHEDYVSSKDAKDLVTVYVLEDLLKAEAGQFEDWYGGGGEDKEDDTGTEVIVIDHNENDGVDNNDDSNDNNDDNDSDNDGDDSESPSLDEADSSASNVSLSFIIQIYLIAFSGKLFLS